MRPTGQYVRAYKKKEKISDLKIFSLQYLIATIGIRSSASFYLITVEYNVFRTIANIVMILNSLNGLFQFFREKRIVFRLCMLVVFKKKR